MGVLNLVDELCCRARGRDGEEELEEGGVVDGGGDGEGLVGDDEAAAGEEQLLAGVLEVAVFVLDEDLEAGGLCFDDVVGDGGQARVGHAVGQRGCG